MGLKQKTPPAAPHDDATQPTLPAGSGNYWSVVGVCVLLAGIIWLVFGQTRGYEFVNYDDDLYVYENPLVAQGLTLQGITSAFSSSHADNWTPLTTISHMLDCQLFGLNAGGHHLTNVLLHTLAVILLFLVLRQMTAAIWPSAFVAALFAIHPLRVESVAWVSERKDVLSGVFFMLTLWAYVWYVRHPRSLIRYLTVAFFFALGLMSKPMLVTLPFVLLLLDYWPLNRFSPAAAQTKVEPAHLLKNFSVARRLVIEKIPLLMLSLTACIPTMLAEKTSLHSAESFALPLRFENALVSYVTHIERMFYPVRLAAFYPYPIHGLLTFEIMSAVLLLAAISLAVFFWRQKHPYLLVGWLWYLGMLVPVIGLVQVGLQAQADRHTYLPQIGLYLLLTWLVMELSASWRINRWMLGISAMVILTGLITCARIQTTYWHDGESLWRHTLACTSDNSIAHDNLGVIFVKQGKMDEAIAQFQKALVITPGNADAHDNLGVVYAKQGRMEEAIAQFQKALVIIPDNADAYDNLGVIFAKQGKMDEAIQYYQKALTINPGFADAEFSLGSAFLQQGQVEEAITEFQKAVAIKPNFAEAQYNLGNAFLQQGKTEEAFGQFQKTVSIKPDYVEAHYNLGGILLQQGHPAEAVTQFQKALAIDPDSFEMLNNLAWLLATCPNPQIRDGSRAVQLAEHACALTHYQKTMSVGTLAAAYAEAGRFDEAMATAQKACDLAEAAGEKELLQKNRELLALYRAHRPYHESSGP
jgi:protein O-mannosyl-transferase